MSDARLWRPWLRINRVLRVMLHTRWSAEAWSVVRVEFRRALDSDGRPPGVGGAGSMARVLAQAIGRTRSLARCVFS